MIFAASSWTQSSSLFIDVFTPEYIGENIIAFDQGLCIKHISDHTQEPVTVQSSSQSILCHQPWLVADGGQERRIPLEIKHITEAHTHISTHIRTHKSTTSHFVNHTHAHTHTQRCSCIYCCDRDGAAVISVEHRFSAVPLYSHTSSLIITE